MDEGYRVVPFLHGIALIGPCSLLHLHGITRIARDSGFDEIAPEIAEAIGATAVFVNAASRQAWRDELAVPTHNVSP
jgi:hypothetical protein